MANRSVTVLSAAGQKIGYESYRDAKKSVDENRASWTSTRCIRLEREPLDGLQRARIVDGVNWRVRRSGRYGPLVMQTDHLANEEEDR
jgi:hypothetical protein